MGAGRTSRGWRDSDHDRTATSVYQFRRCDGSPGNAAKDHPLSIRLWNSGIPEARIVASMIADPAEMTAAEMDRWVSGFRFMGRLRPGLHESL